MTNLVADWDMTDASGTTLTDAVATAANGTLTNGPTWLTQNTVGDCSAAANIFVNGYNFKTLPETQTETLIEPMYFSVYPNPNNGTFTIVMPQLSNDCLIRVYDVKGRIVYSKSLTPSKEDLFKETINLGNIADQ